METTYFWIEAKYLLLVQNSLLESVKLKHNTGSCEGEERLSRTFDRHGLVVECVLVWTSGGAESSLLTRGCDARGIHYFALALAGSLFAGKLCSRSLLIFIPKGSAKEIHGTTYLYIF